MPATQRFNEEKLKPGAEQAAQSLKTGADRASEGLQNAADKFADQAGMQHHAHTHSHVSVQMYSCSLESPQAVSS